MEENLLIKLLEDGFLTHTVKLGDTELAVVKTLSVDEQLEMEQVLSSAVVNETTERKAMQMYAKKAAAYALVSFKGNKVASVDVAEEILGGLSIHVFDRIVGEQQKLEKKVKALLSNEKLVEETFTEGAKEKQS